MTAHIGGKVRLELYRTYRVEEVVEVLASALYGDDEDARAIAQESIERSIRERVDDGQLVVRDPVNLGVHALPVGAALRKAVLLPHEVRQLLKERGLATEEIGEPEGPRFWTLRRAAMSLGKQLGWHQGAIDSLVMRMVTAAGDGDLIVRDSHTELPYRPSTVRPFLDLVCDADVNGWLTRKGAEYRWEPHDSVVPSENAPVPHDEVDDGHAGDGRKRRANVLDAIIKRAISEAEDPTDYQSVWVTLRLFASSPEPPPPLLRFKNGDVEYDDDGGPKPLNKAAFKKRWDRLRASS